MRSLLGVFLPILCLFFSLVAKANMGCQSVWSDSFGKNNVLEVDFKNRSKAPAKDLLTELLQSEIPNGLVIKWTEYLRTVQEQISQSDVMLLGQHGVNGLIEPIQEIQISLRNTVSKSSENQKLLSLLKAELDKTRMVLSSQQVQERLRSAGIKLSSEDVLEPIRFYFPTKEFSEQIAGIEAKSERLAQELWDLRYKSMWDIPVITSFMMNSARFDFLEGLNRLLFQFDGALRIFRRDNDLKRVDNSQIIFLARQIRKNFIHTDFVVDQIAKVRASVFPSTRESGIEIQNRIQSIDAQVDLILNRGIYQVSRPRGLQARNMELQDAMITYYSENTFEMRLALKDMIQYFKEHDYRDESPNDMAKLASLLQSCANKTRNIRQSREHFGLKHIKEAEALIQTLSKMIQN